MHPWSLHSPRTVLAQSSHSLDRSRTYPRISAYDLDTSSDVYKRFIGEEGWSEEVWKRAPLRSDTHIAKFELPTPVRRHFRLIRNSRQVHANSRAPGTSLHAG